MKVRAGIETSGGKFNCKSAAASAFKERGQYEERPPTRVGREKRGQKKRHTNELNGNDG